VGSELPGVNRLKLTGKLLERGALRYTPAGLPALDLMLVHESIVEEEGIPRKVTMEIKAVAIGTISVKAQGLQSEVPALFSGFLTASRNGRGHVFQLTDIESHQPN